MSLQITVSHTSHKHNQRGAVLVVSMLLLLVMTVLALGASQATRMQERMAGNSRDYDLALQSAEAGLRTAERLIDDPALTAAPFPCTVEGRCKVWSLNLAPDDIAYKSPAAWWNAKAWAYSPTNTWNDTAGSSISGAGLAARDPQFVIEEIDDVEDSLKVPTSGAVPSRIYYRITSTAQGGTDQAVVTLQTTFSRRFN